MAYFVFGYRFFIEINEANIFLQPILAIVTLMLMFVLNDAVMTKQALKLPVCSYFKM